VYSGVPAHWVGRSQEIEIGPMSGNSNVTHYLSVRGLPATAEIISSVLAEAKKSDRVLTEPEVLAAARRTELTGVGEEVRAGRRCGNGLHPGEGRGRELVTVAYCTTVLVVGLVEAPCGRPVLEGCSGPLQFLPGMARPSVAIAMIGRLTIDHSTASSPRRTVTAPPARRTRSPSSRTLTTPPRAEA
jgi:hypothetical protein